MEIYNKKKCSGILIILIALALIIVVYGLLIRLFFGGNMIHGDFINKKICNFDLFGSNCCSLWPVSHLVLHLILAFIFPDCVIFLFSLGVLWELIEMSADLVIRHFSKGQKLKEYSKKIEYTGSWMAGSFKDIIFNGLGLIIGFSLRKAYDKLKKNKEKGRR